DQLAESLVADGGQRLLLALVRQLLLDGRPGTLEGAVDRRDARVESVGGLLGGEAEHLAEDQDGALVRRQQLQGRDEGELDRLPLLVSRVRRGVAVLQAERVGRVGPVPGGYATSL